MGVAAADYDDDGDMDIVKTDFSDDIPNVYHNGGGAQFEIGCFDRAWAATCSTWEARPPDRRGS